MSLAVTATHFRLLESRRTGEVNDVRMFFDEACCTGPVGTDAVFRGVNAAFQHQDA